MQIKIWLTNPKEVLQGAKPNFHPDAQVLDFASNGWLEVSIIEIPNPTLPPVDTIREKTVAAFRAKIHEVRAKAESQVRILEHELNKLLAIGYEQPANAADRDGVIVDDGFNSLGGDPNPLKR
jgi:hypothetical protein